MSTPGSLFASVGGVQHTFVVLSRQIGLRAPARSHGHGPRLHDLRHRLAVTTLMRWYRAGVDVDSKLPERKRVTPHVAFHCLWACNTTPHVLRHTAAMELLRSGVDRAVIVLWLGHESVETTQMYLDADLALKERALARTIGGTTFVYRFSFIV